MTATAEHQVLPPKAFTAFPINHTTDLVDLEPWLDGPPYGRYVVELAEDIAEDIILGNMWQEHRLVDGRPVWLRKADCGAGCRCSAEYSLSPRE